MCRIAYPHRKIFCDDRVQRKHSEIITPSFSKGLRTSQKKNKSLHFSSSLASKPANPIIPPGIRTWRDALVLLRPVLGTHPTCIVLDEFQLNGNSVLLPKSPGCVGCLSAMFHRDSRRQTWYIVQSRLRRQLLRVGRSMRFCWQVGAGAINQPPTRTAAKPSPGLHQNRASRVN